MIPSDTQKQIISLSQTLSKPAIAKQLNISLYTVGRYLKLANVQTKNAQIYNENKQLAKTGERRCTRCKEIFPLDSEHFPHSKTPHCKECFKLDCQEGHQRYIKKMTLEQILRIRLTHARKRERRENIKVSVTLDNLIDLWHQQQGKCFYTGEQMQHTVNLPTSVSLDRKDSSQAYSLDNVVLCCATVNEMKWDKSITEFIEWCSKVCDNAGHNKIRASCNEAEPASHSSKLDV